MKALLAAALLTLAIATPVAAGDPVDGIASHWSGPVAAAPWCTFPWTDCGWVDVQSHRTGVTIRIHVAMYCQCYVRTPDERLIDLTAGQVLALGEDLNTGLYQVTVTRVGEQPTTLLPNTATR